MSNVLTRTQICCLPLSCLATILVVTLPLTSYFHRIVYAICVVAAVGIVGSQYALMPSAITEAFGEKYASINIGLVYMSTVSHSSINYLLLTFISSGDSRHRRSVCFSTVDRHIGLVWNDSSGRRLCSHRYYSMLLSFVSILLSFVSIVCSFDRFLDYIPFAKQSTIETQKKVFYGNKRKQKFWFNSIIKSFNYRLISEQNIKTKGNKSSDHSEATTGVFNYSNTITISPITTRRTSIPRPSLFKSSDYIPEATRL